MEKVGRSAVWGRSMNRAGLAKARVISRDGEVASHSDLLAAGDPHSIHSADDWLVAEEDCRHHVIEQAHVLRVLAWATCVIGGVFLGVSAAAKRLVAGAGEHHRHCSSVCAGPTHGKDDLSYGIRRV